MENDILITEFFPENFFHKSVNEPFIRLLMGQVLGKGEWKQGDPNTKEPDYFFNNIPFEFTLASNRKKKNNLIQKIKAHQYSSDDLESDVFSYISASLESKNSKSYSVSNVHLCVLCILDMFDWVSDVYGSETYSITDNKRQQFFMEIKQKYLGSEKFQDIFLIFPDVYAKWWIWDVLTGHRASIQLSADDIHDRKLPFVILTNVYSKLVSGYKSKDVANQNLEDSDDFVNHLENFGV